MDTVSLRLLLTTMIHAMGKLASTAPAPLGLEEIADFVLAIETYEQAGSKPTARPSVKGSVQRMGV